MLNQAKLPLIYSLFQFVIWHHTYAQPLTGADYLSKPARVISWQVNVEGMLTVPDAQGTTDKVKSYKYFDGFGRPLQDIIEGATPAGKDLIQLYSYDGFGRHARVDPPPFPPPFTDFLLADSLPGLFLPPP